MKTLRTRFRKEIVTEFLPPTKPSRKVIIFASGMPGVPSGKELLPFFAKKGYWVFLPRYRGSWESGGRFLKNDPTKDILDIIDGLPSGFTDLWNNKQYHVKPENIFIIGGSFGGPAALLASRDRRVTKVVALSPVVDWTAPMPDEPMDKLGRFLGPAFGNAYRFSMADWRKLMRGKFYSPVAHVHELDPKKILIIHAKNDLVVTWPAVRKFIKQLGCQSIVFKRGGHLPRTILTRPSLVRQLERFFRS